MFAALHGDWRRDKWSLEKISKTSSSRNLILTLLAAERDDGSRDWRTDTEKPFCSVNTMIRTKLSSCGEWDVSA